MQGKDAVLRREGIQAAMLQHDGADTAAAVTVACLGSHRQAIFHGDACRNQRLPLRLLSRTNAAIARTEKNAIPMTIISMGRLSPVAAVTTGSLTV